MTKQEFLTKWNPIRTAMNNPIQDFESDLTALLQFPTIEEAKNLSAVYSGGLENGDIPNDHIKPYRVGFMRCFDWLAKHRVQQPQTIGYCQCKEGPSGRTVNENYNQICDRCGKETYHTEQPEAKLTPKEVEKRMIQIGADVFGQPEDKPIPISEEIMPTEPQFPSYLELSDNVICDNTIAYNTYRWLKHWYYGLPMDILLGKKPNPNFTTIAEAKLQQPVDDGWIKTKNQEPLSTFFELIGFNKEWIDPDFNPKGQRICFIDDDGEWFSAEWSDSNQEYMSRMGDIPTYWKYLSESPKSE